MKNKGQGQLSNLALGVILTIVTLFIGLYTISTVADLQSESTLYDFSYNTSSNTTSKVFNTSDTYDAVFVIGVMPAISGEADPTKEITIIVNNTNQTTTFTINATLNGASLGTFSATNGTNTTEVYTSASFVGNATNNITVGMTSRGTNTTVTNVTIEYPASRSTTSWYTLQGNLITNTGTIFDVLILVIIVVSLGVAIAVLRGFGRTREVSPI